MSRHHFDPTFDDLKRQPNPQHDHNGIIALCHTHADLADGRRWTPDQLRQMKQKPFMTQDRIKDSYDYLRKDTVCLVGNIAFRVKKILTVDWEPVIWFERDSKGCDRLNLHIRDSSGQVILHMENNDWTVYTKDIFDLICPAQGKELQIISKDKRINFTFRFDEYSLFDFGNLMDDSDFKSDATMKILMAAKCQEHVPLWTMTGTLLWGRNHLKIVPGRLTELNLNNSISGSVTLDFDSAVTFNDGMFSMASMD